MLPLFVFELSAAGPARVAPVIAMDANAGAAVSHAVFLPVSFWCCVGCVFSACFFFDTVDANFFLPAQNCYLARFSN